MSCFWTFMALGIFRWTVFHLMHFFSTSSTWWFLCHLTFFGNIRFWCFVVACVLLFGLERIASTLVRLGSSCSFFWQLFVDQAYDYYNYLVPYHLVPYNMGLIISSFSAPQSQCSMSLCSDVMNESTVRQSSVYAGWTLAAHKSHSCFRWNMHQTSLQHHWMLRYLRHLSPEMLKCHLLRLPYCTLGCLPGPLRI